MCPLVTKHLLRMSMPNLFIHKLNKIAFKRLQPNSKIYFIYLRYISYYYYKRLTNDASFMRICVPVD